jgi:hypothetical protein
MKTINWQKRFHGRLVYDTLGKYFYNAADVTAFNDPIDPKRNLEFIEGRLLSALIICNNRCFC